MLRDFLHFRDTVVKATDGPVGVVKDVYFDVSKWVIWWLAVEAGAAAPGRTFLVSPLSILRAGDDSIELLLTGEQVLESPSVDGTSGISQEDHARVLDHYGGHYLRMPGFDAADSDSAAIVEMRSAAVLRSASNIVRTGAFDRLVGRVADLVIDDRSWQIEQIIIGARQSTCSVRVPVTHVQLIEAADHTVHIQSIN